MPAETAASDGPLLTLEHVSKAYAQAGVDVMALDDVSLSVDRGEFVAIQGSSGSGKSTLLHVLGLLDRPDEGRYLLEGRDVAGLDDDHRSDLRNRAIGFVFQSFHLIPYATVLDNVLLPGLYGGGSMRAMRRRAQELLDLVGLGDRGGFKPNQLSGGQQQRVALARALLHEPDLILADEPTGQLDTDTGRGIMELLGRINGQGSTVVLVTHDPAMAAFARRVVRMRDGQIIQGPTSPTDEA